MKKLFITTALCLLGFTLSAQSLEVVSTSPANGSFGVSTNEITIEFNHPVAIDNEHPDRIEFFNIIPLGLTEPYGYSFSPDSTIVTFYVDLPENSDFTALVLGAEGVNGEQMEAPYFFRFTTAPEIGQYTVTGSLTANDMNQLKEELQGDFVVIALTDEELELSKLGDEDQDMKYATILLDFENLTYSIPYVREGTYYPFGFAPESSSPTFYLYDTDDDIETPDVITVNAANAVGNIVSGVDLKQLKFNPITAAEAVAMADDVKNQIDENAALMKVASYYDSSDEHSTILLGGVSSNWHLFYYNPTDEQFYEIEVAPNGAKLSGIVNREGIGYPSEFPISNFNPVPATFIDSDQVLTIAAANGGSNFMESFSNTEEYQIHMSVELSHQYWAFNAGLLDNIPVSWLVHYTALQNGMPIDYFGVFVDTETGELLGEQSSGFTVNGFISAPDIQALKDEIQGRTVWVALTRSPQNFDIYNSFVFDVVYQVQLDNESLTYSFQNVDGGAYYPIAYTEDMVGQLPTFYLYDTDDNIGSQDVLHVNTANAVDRTIAGIELKQWKIQPISFEEALSSSKYLVPEDAIIISASANYSVFGIGERTFDNDGRLKGWMLELYSPEEDKYFNLYVDPLAAHMSYQYDATAGEFDGLAPLPAEMLNSSEAVAAAGTFGADTFLANFAASGMGDYFLSINYTLLSDFNYEQFYGELPEDGSGFYWILEYSYNYYDVINDDYLGKSLTFIIDAVTGANLSTETPDPPIEVGEFIVEGSVTADDIQALKDEIENQRIFIALSKNKPYEALKNDDTIETVAGTLLNTETLTFRFTNVAEGTYYIIGIRDNNSVNNANDDGALFVFYLFDTDDNVDTEESITINSETTTDDILSGITLKQWKLLPFTFQDAVVKAQPVADGLAAGLKLAGGTSENKIVNPTAETRAPFIAKGTNSEWMIYYLDTSKEEFHLIAVTTFGTFPAFSLQWNEAEGVEGVDINSIKAVPANALSSAAVAAIAETNGGSVFRNSFFGKDYSEIKMEMEILHKYWEFEPNPTPSAPVMWLVKYTADYWDGSENKDSLHFYLDAVSGDILLKVGHAGDDTAAEPITADIPTETSLLQNYPNPFNPSTNIPFTLKKAAHVELTVYNVTGQKVATLVNKSVQAGRHTLQWNASQFASGIYFYRFVADGVVQTRKLTLIK